MLIFKCISHCLYPNIWQFNRIETKTQDSTKFETHLNFETRIRNQIPASYQRLLNIEYIYEIVAGKSNLLLKHDCLT